MGSVPWLSLTWAQHEIEGCGSSGIRTPDTVSSMTVFKTVPFNHSGKLPNRWGSVGLNRTKLLLALTSSYTWQLRVNRVSSTLIFDPETRIELATYWLQISCSTCWAILDFATFKEITLWVANIADIRFGAVKRADLTVCHGRLRRSTFERL